MERVLFEITRLMCIEIYNYTLFHTLPSDETTNSLASKFYRISNLKFDPSAWFLVYFISSRSIDISTLFFSFG